MRWARPFDGSVAMAADDEHLGVVPLDRLAEDTPSVPLHRLKHGVAHLQHIIPYHGNGIYKRRGWGRKNKLIDLLLLFFFKKKN